MGPQVSYLTMRLPTKITASRTWLNPWEGEPDPPSKKYSVTLIFYPVHQEGTGKGGLHVAQRSHKVRCRKLRGAVFLAHQS